MTIKTRIIFLIAGAGLIFGLMFSGVVFYELIEQPFKLLDTLLEEEAYRIVNTVKRNNNADDKKTSGDPYVLISDKYWIIVYESNTHEIIYQSFLAKLVDLTVLNPGSSAIVRTIVPREKIDLDQGRNQEVHFRVKSFSVKMDDKIFIVQIARAMERFEEEIRELIIGILIGFVASTLALIALSRLLAGKILKPIGQMKSLAQEISEKNLDQRIPAGDSQDEFNELSRTINRMLDRLQYSFARQKDFLFDTSHELKTPLTTMRLAVDEMCASDTESLQSFARENVFRLKTQVLRMERLVKDLLNLSYLEATTGIDFKPVQICDLLSSLADEYKFLADAREIEMNIRLSGRLVIPGDGEKLHRAFSNLFDNAIRYNVDGGRIELTIEQFAGEVAVTIGNTGPGVPQAEIPKVFDQFYRAEKSRSARGGGSGLGLAIVKRIVELHGGKVEFESRPESWTRVTVSLPLTVRDTTPPASIFS